MLWKRSRAAVALEWKALRREAIVEDGEALKVSMHIHPPRPTMHSRFCRRVGLVMCARPVS